jgi:hypothetical protein
MKRLTRTSGSPSACRSRMYGCPRNRWRSSELLAPAGGGFFTEPLVNQPVRAREDLRGSALRKDVAEKREGLNTRGRPKLAPVIGVDVPATGRYSPFLPAGESYEQSPPPLGLCIRIGSENGADRGEQTFTSDCREDGLVLQVLKLCRSLDGPARRFLASDPGFRQAGPSDLAHGRSRMAVERLPQAHPAMLSEMLEGLVGAHAPGVIHEEFCKADFQAIGIQRNPSTRRARSQQDRLYPVVVRGDLVTDETRFTRIIELGGVELERSVPNSVYVGECLQDRLGHPGDDPSRDVEPLAGVIRSRVSPSAGRAARSRPAAGRCAGG